MANHIPPPAQGVMNCFASISPRTRSKVVAGLLTALCLNFIGILVSLGLGLGKKISQNVGPLLTGSLITLLIILGIALVLISFCDRRPSPRQNFIFQPILLRLPSDDSGLGSSSSSLLDVQNGNGSRENLHGSHDSGINIV